METEVRQADVQEILERHQARYEVRPYYNMVQVHPAGAPAVERKVQAGFDVELFGTLLKNEPWPPERSEEPGMVAEYFERVAQEVQTRVGQQCRLQVITHEDSLMLDTKHHFQPEVMLTIRIDHYRGLDQTEGPAEEQALGEIRGVLRDLGVREASE